MLVIRKKKINPELIRQQDGFAKTHQPKDRIWSLNSVTLIFTPFRSSYVEVSSS